MDAREIEAYLGERYQAYLEELPAEDWADRYEQFFERTLSIASALQGEGREALEQACATAGVPGGLDDYLKQALYDRDNGVSGLGQGGLSQDGFSRVCRDDEFLITVSRVLSLVTAPTPANVVDTFDQAIKWMEEFSSRNRLNRFPAVVNRYFAGCFPGVVTTIAADGHLRALIAGLEPAGIPDLHGSWLKANRFLMTLMTQWLDGKHLEGDTKYRRSIFFWWLYENGFGGYEDHQVVFYGSPGSGKTWKAKRIANARVEAWRQQRHQEQQPSDEQIVTVQFHPSFGYEDFVEGIRPRNNEGRHELALADGVFKSFCRSAARWETAFYDVARRPVTPETTVSEARKILDLLDGALWSPVLEGAGDAAPLIDHLPPYFLIIDEINRAELSRVLGELMYALEYRGIQGKIKTQYASLVKSKTDPGAFLFINNENYFFVPHNLFLFGTMNVIDRSLDTFDFALRRRFRWEEVAPDMAAARTILRSLHVEEPLIDRALAGLARLNERIGANPFLGPDYAIGHAYMKHIADFNGPGGAATACEFLWRTRLQPLIEEYLRGMGKQDRIRTEMDGFRKSFLG